MRLNLASLPMNAPGPSLSRTCVCHQAPREPQLCTGVAPTTFISPISTLPSNFLTRNLSLLHPSQRQPRCQLTMCQQTSAHHTTTVSRSGRRTSTPSSGRWATRNEWLWRTCCRAWSTSRGGWVVVCLYVYVCMHVSLCACVHVWGNYFSCFPPQLPPCSPHNFPFLMADIQPQGTAIRTAFQPPLVPARVESPRLDGRSAGAWRDAFMRICMLLDTDGAQVSIVSCSKSLDYLSLCIYACVYGCLCARVCMYACVYVCMYACVYGCLCVRARVCVCMRVCVQRSWDAASHRIHMVRRQLFIDLVMDWEVCVRTQATDMSIYLSIYDILCCMCEDTSDGWGIWSDGHPWLAMTESMNSMLAMILGVGCDLSSVFFTKNKIINY